MKNLYLLVALLGMVSATYSEEYSFRYSENFEEGLLETEISSFEKDGLSIDLVAAIHLGNKEYYDELNETFKSYDALFYEMIGTPQEIECKAGGPVLRFAEALQFKSQVCSIDYSSKNLVHADYTSAEFQNELKKRNTSINQLMQELGKQVIQDKELFEPLMSVTEIVMGRSRLTIPERRHTVATILFSKATGLLRVFNGSFLIEARNEHALNIMYKNLPGKKRVGLYYGALHMNSLKKELSKRGFIEKRTRWVTAWKFALPRCYYNSLTPASLEYMRNDRIAIMKALNEFKAKKGRFPSAEEGLSAVKLSQSYQYHDPWGRPYQYQLNEESLPVVFSLGLDGKAGGGMGKDVYFDCSLQ